MSRTPERRPSNRARIWHTIALALAILPFSTESHAGRPRNDHLKSYTEPRVPTENDIPVTPTEQAEFKRALSEQDEKTLLGMRSALNEFAEILTQFEPHANYTNAPSCLDKTLCESIQIVLDMAEHAETLDELIEKAQAREWVVLAIHEHIQAESEELFQAMERIRTALSNPTSLTEAIRFVYQTSH